MILYEKKIGLDSPKPRKPSEMEKRVADCRGWPRTIGLRDRVSSAQIKVCWEKVVHGSGLAHLWEEEKNCE